MSKILQKTEINLIKKSTICDKNTNLSKVLEMFPNGINKKDLKTLKKDFIDVYDRIATAELREILINDSASEWKQGEYIGEKNIPCELCGNKFSKQKFTIINKFNSMLVGSDCICKFANINKMITGENLNTIKNSEVFDKLVKFNKIYEKGKNNIFNYIDILYNILKKHKYYTSIDDEMYDSGYFKIYNKNNKVARVNLNDLLDAEFLFVLKNKPENIDNYMKNLNWKDKSDENKFDIGNIGKLQTGGNFI